MMPDLLYSILPFGLPLLFSGWLETCVESTVYENIDEGDSELDGEGV